MKKRKGYSRWIGNFIRFAIVFCIFVFLFTTDKLEFSILKNVLAKPNLFVSATLLIFAGALISVQRWRLLLKVHNVHLGVGSAIKLTFIGQFFSAALPGAVSGDAVKAYYIARDQKQKTALVSTVILDRLIGIYTFVLFATLAVLFTIFCPELLRMQDDLPQQPIIVLFYFIIGLFALFTSLGIICARKESRVARLLKAILVKLPFHNTFCIVYDAVYEYGHKWKLTLNALFVSLASQIPFYAGMWCLATLLEIKIRTSIVFFLALPACMLINAIPLAPGGIGIGEAGFESIFSLFGSNKGAELAILFHAIYYILSVGVGGMVYLFSNFTVGDKIE